MRHRALREPVVQGSQLVCCGTELPHFARELAGTIDRQHACGNALLMYVNAAA